MAKLLGEIEWGEPVLPPVVIPNWEAEVKAHLGGVNDFLRRVALIPWLRSTCLRWQLYPLKALPLRLADIGLMVTSQENSCRYCYGAARAHLRILGYSEKLISKIERETQLAELNEKERAFIRFCRNLARSKPRPAREQREQLIELGFTPLVVAEMAFYIADVCFHNRVKTFLAVPPEIEFERIGNSFLRRLLRPIVPTVNRMSIPVPVEPPPVDGMMFRPVVNALAGLPAATLLHEALTGAFASPVISRPVKLLMFAVVARLLDCSFCNEEARIRLATEGMARDEIESCLSSFASPNLNAQESSILAWTRDTVHYEPQLIQKQTRALLDTIGAEALLEAVGVAALANATVRLTMLLE
jgi:alkylhydroperoxidase family enzyme